MLVAPRIVAIDDNPRHLQGLVDGLHRCGTSCLPILFRGDSEGIGKCPGLRVMFADLHLNESGAGGDYERHFAIIGGLIEETFAPAGPYVLILWTQYPDHADALRDFLEARLESVAKPLAVVALDKARHLDPTAGNVKDPAALVSAIRRIIDEQPQLAALLNWEEHVLNAASETAAAILALTGTAKSSTERVKELSRLLARLASEAVGKDHVEHNRFGAVNEALLPILADRIAFIRLSDTETAIWTKAFDETAAQAALSLEEAARLNRMLHVDECATTTAVVRGSVSALSADSRGDAFRTTFGIDEISAAKAEFGYKDFDLNNAEFRWMLVQTQAACDFAQCQAGTIPYLLALEGPCNGASKEKPPAALWRGPPLYLRNQARCLHVNSRFHYQLSRDAATAIVASYRLREQLLSEILHLSHSQGSRPGSITFRERKSKQ